MPPNCSIPIPIADSETIVRAIKRPSHLKGKGANEKLKVAAFKSVAGVDDVSVMRQTHMGATACRQKGIELVQGNDKVQYAGLAVVTAAGIRASGSTVSDTREEFCGHASICHGFVLTRDEPEDSETAMKVNERIHAILEATTFYRDPSPEIDNWAASSLDLASGETAAESVGP
jgi:hypothetical protein